MKIKEEKQQEAKVRQAEYDKLTPKQKYLKLDLKLGDLLGAKKQRRKLELQILAKEAMEIPSGAIPMGVGDSVNKDKKKPYQKPKKS